MSRKRCFTLTNERDAEELFTIEFLLYFFPGLSIGLKQFGIAPCITPFSSIEWHHMERRYIWPFLLTWRLETCAFLSACDSSITIWDCVYLRWKLTGLTDFESWSQWKSLFIFWEQGGKIYSQLTFWCQGITALQQMWSETGDLFTFLCLILSIFLSEYPLKLANVAK